MKRLICALLMFTASRAMAGTYTIPNTFTPSTTAQSSQVNGNFTAAKSAIDDNDARLDALLATDTCTTPPCALTAGTTMNGVTIILTNGNIGAGSATTPAPGDNSTSIATTQFVQSAIDNRGLANSGQTTNRLVKTTGTTGDIVGTGITVDGTNNMSGVESIIVGTTGTGCLMLQDTDALGWTEVCTLNGVVSAGIDADGVIDGTP